MGQTNILLQPQSVPLAALPQNESLSLSFSLRVVPKICIKSLKTRASGNFPLRNTHNICQQLATRCIVNDDDCKQKQHTMVKVKTFMA